MMLDGLQASRLRGLWLAMMVALVASRLLLVPGQPWEQDEALFAAASIDADVSVSRPHPPGFPLWVAVGKLGLWLIGDPLLGLQLVSAVASLLTVLALAWLWARLLEDADLGWAAAALYGFAPAVLFHAPRAFTTTPCLCLATCACVVWTRPGRRWLVAGAMLMAGALLVRPVAAPMLVVTLAGALALRRSRLADWLIATVIVAAVTVLGFVPLVLGSGGLEPFLEALSRHRDAHFGAVHLPTWRLARLGVVRAVGGVIAAAAVLGLSVLGWSARARRQPRFAAWWLALILVSAAWILLAHNRTYPRYTLPLLALASGPVVAGIQVLVRRVRTTCWTAALLAMGALVWTAPALITQATTTPPAVSALTAAQSTAEVRGVIVDGALSPFSDLMALARRARVPFTWRPLIAQGRLPSRRLPAPWAYVWSDGTPLAWIPGPTEQPSTFSCTSKRVQDLAQDRFLTCRVARRGAIILAPAGLRFDAPQPVGLEHELVVLMQPATGRSWLGAVLEIGGSPATVELVVGNDLDRRLELAEGRHVIHAALSPDRRRAARHATVARLRRHQGGSVTVHRLWIDPTDGRFTPRSMTAPEQADGLDGLITGHGFHAVERFGQLAAAGRWTSAVATLSVPAGRGSVAVDLAAPRPEPARVTLRSRRPRWSKRLLVGGQWRSVEIPMKRGHARLELTIEVANPFIPAEHIQTSSDRRTLGVVLGEVRFTPAR